MTRDIVIIEYDEEHLDICNFFSRLEAASLCEGNEDGMYASSSEKLDNVSYTCILQLKCV